MICVRTKMNWNNLTLILTLSLSLITSSCKSSKISHEAKVNALNLQEVEKISLGSHQDKILQLFGDPDIQEDVADNSEETAFIYINKNSTLYRTLLFFNKTTKKLTAKTWLAEETDPEINVQYTLKKFPTAHFKTREGPWLNEHAASDDIFYEDKKLGLRIQVRQHRNEIYSITWE